VVACQQRLQAPRLPKNAIFKPNELLAQTFTAWDAINIDRSADAENAVLHRQADIVFGQRGLGCG
jgi:hypothetical protein